MWHWRLKSNSDLITAINYILTCIQIKQTIILNHHNILQHYCFYCILYFFVEINAALLSRRDFIQEHYNVWLVEYNYVKHIPHQRSCWAFGRRLMSGGSEAAGKRYLRWEEPQWMCQR